MPASLRQIEAFYWTARLRSFSDAARHLNLAQSTISKRIIELEGLIGTPLFDRTSQTLRLTSSGEASLPLAAEMLALEPRFRDAAGGGSTFSGFFRFGITELVALTWLPRLILSMKQAFPNVVPAPEVAASVELFNKLADRQLDLVIGLDPPLANEFSRLPLDQVQLEWVAAPGFGPVEPEIPLEEIGKYPILSQARGSGLQRLVLDWAASNGLQVNRIVECNSLNVLAGLAAAGLGVTFLTASYFAPEIAAGHLRIIRTLPPIPPLRYYAVHWGNDLSPLAASIGQIAQKTCDFSARSLPRD